MLEMKHVVKSFGTFRALDDLSLTVPQGAVYGLVGPNGAGKSTAIRHLTGVYRADSGEVTLEGMPIFENPKAKGRIGCIPDDVFYYPGATLEEMRKFYKGIYPNFDDGLFNRLGEIFRLPEKTPIRRYSKGMQKQAAFHLTVSIRPEVLILDEPVDGLDPVMRRQVMSVILADVAEHGTTVLPQPAGAGGRVRPCGHHGQGKDAPGAEPGGHAGQYPQAADRGGHPGGPGNSPRIHLRTAENPDCPGPGLGDQHQGGGSQACLL